jgi:SAM-dependent methyltransferase
LNDLIFSEAGATCGVCGQSYPKTPEGRDDLRLRTPKRHTLEFQVGPSTNGHDVPRFELMPANPSAQLDYRSIPIPNHLQRGNRLTRELLSYFPRSENGGAMLDVGCGGEPFRDICAHTNLEYVGIDYDRAPTMLADAHALPFRSDSFELAISFAVLEHIRHPQVALREIHRVLKPGAPFIGTVAFLEPFHLDSYFHPTHLGTYILLSAAGFEVEQLEPNIRWSGLHAQAAMGLFPHMSWSLARAMVLPLELMHRLWWKIGRVLQPRPATSEAARRLVTTAGFRFVCRKPSAPQPARADAQANISAGAFS